MKKREAQKLMLLLLAVMCACAAKSQDSTDYTLNNIRKYASRMEESFPALGHRAGDERKVQMQAAERLKAFSDSIEEEMEYLPDDYYFKLSPLVSAYRADINEYEKLVANDDFEGKEKCLSALYASLQQRQTGFRQAVLTSYQNVVSKNTLSGQSATKMENNDTPAAAQPRAGDDSSIAQGSHDTGAASQMENTGKNKASKNAVLLDTIHAALQQIASAIPLTERAVTKNNESNIRLGTTRIADASLTISGLSLLLDAKGKENLYVLAASLQHAAENLRKLAKKGAPARSEMRNSISEMKIKFNNLSTGISFVK